MPRAGMRLLFQGIMGGEAVNQVYLSVIGCSHICFGFEFLLSLVSLNSMVVLGTGIDDLGSIMSGVIVHH